MTKEEKIKAIYEKISDKTLSFRCIIKIKKQEYNEYPYGLEHGGELETNEYELVNIGEIFIDRKLNKYKLTNGSIEEMIFKQEFSKRNPIYKYKIIGHPVMIGDVLDYCIGDKELNSKRLLGQNTIFGLLNRWKEKRKPIEEQSEECIDYVYNLLPKE